MRTRLAVFLTLLFLASLTVGGVYRIVHDGKPSAPANPTPTTVTASSADPYARYYAIPTATPGCPTNLDPELLRKFWRQCPQGGTK